LNDIFRPILSGNLVWFRFSVYNRWGEKVFETSTPRQGWDGRLNGITQPSGAYVWFCDYQLEGQQEKSKKGTVVLIK
jgi:gliding motility-associated-like protein